MKFNIAQTFFIPAIASTSQPVSALTLTSLDLYFMYKPGASNNRTGVTLPGVTVFITETIYGVPKITSETYTNFARLEWQDVLTSSDASMASRCYFQQPIEVTPGKYYAILLAYDANEVFFPWLAIKGSKIVGTNTIFEGTNLIGNYYEAASGVTMLPENAKTQEEYFSFWRPLNDSQMKFKVNAARFFVDNVPVGDANTGHLVMNGSYLQTWNAASNTITYHFPAPKIEQVVFDTDESSFCAFISAQRVFQNTVFYPGGPTAHTVSCNSASPIIVASATLPNGASFSWTDVFNSYAGNKYVTLFDNNYVNIRGVLSQINSTALFLDEPVSFTNTTTKFMISPVATIDSFLYNSPRGREESFMFLTHSSANSTVRFVNNTIESIDIVDGGTGYDNADVLYVTGYEYVNNKITTGYPAVANVLTDVDGTIVSVYMSNLGCGFINASEAVFAIGPDLSNITNSTSNTSSGSSAEFSLNIGATLRTELSNNHFRKCEVVNLDLYDVTPFFQISSPIETTFAMYLKHLYRVANDSETSLGLAYYLLNSPENTIIDLEMLSKTRFINDDNIPVFMSYSNEFGTHYSNGSPNDLVDPLNTFSNNFVVYMDVQSGNDYVSVAVNTNITLEFSKYIVNDDYTNEHTNHGACWAKHIVTEVPFTRLSEDLRIYLTAYKPSNTNFQVYARLQNSGDPQAFDDTDWTRLELIDGKNILSSLNKHDDYIELTYGMRLYPNVEFTVAGAILTTNNSANVTGSNTKFTSNTTANIVSGDMVRIYSALFPNTDFMVATVTDVANNTHLTLDQPVLSTMNPNLVNPGLKMDKIGFPHQAYNDINNENVATYYDTSLVNYDGFDRLQIKVCLLSNNLVHIPRIHDIRAIGVSA